jgi:two-component system sensor histidine kinase/response regulator
MRKDDFDRGVTLNRWMFPVIRPIASTLFLLLTIIAGAAVSLAQTTPRERIMPIALVNGVFLGAYDYRIVALSIFIAMLASYAALDLGGRVTAAHGRVRVLWLAGGSVTMGLGIWAMHYVGMLAWTLPVPILYDWPTVLVSLLMAILASATALFVVSRRAMGPVSTGVGGLVMGLGIASMHYLGMDAMRLSAMCRYSNGLLALSVMLAILISLVALWLTFHLRHETGVTDWRKLASAVLMGVAIPSMHYTGMAAVTFVPMASHGSLTHAVAISTLGTVVISSITLIILGLTILSSLIDRRFAAQALELKHLTEALRVQNEHLEEIVASRTRELADAHGRLTILDKAKDDFLRIISHELRTPLNGLLGVSELVLNESPASEEATELRSMFEQSRQRMMSLLDDALLLTQIDAGAERFRSLPLSVNVALDRAMERTVAFADLRRVSLEPAPADLGQVWGQEDLLVRSFHALLETAVKFSEEGETIRLAREVAPKSLRVIIESQGRIIPNFAIAKFFDTFSIGDAIAPGSDLGLSAPVASRILSLFGSTVTVRNREPSGIRLTVEFPFEVVTPDFCAWSPAARIRG